MAIVAGAGGPGNVGGATSGSTPPIQINSGDVAVAFGLIPMTSSALSVASPSNPVWQQRFFASMNPFFLYLWTLENPTPANEPVTFTRPLAGAGLGLVQVYSGVGAITNITQGSAIGTANPSMSPAVTTTVPGSMAVGWFGFNRGSSNAFAVLPLTGERSLLIGTNYAALLLDLMVPTPSSVQLAVASTSTQPTGFNYFSAALVLEPVVVAPPPLPTASLSASESVITVGQSTMLSWSTTDAATAYISGIGFVPLSGSQQVSPGDTTLYTLIATGPGGSQTATFLVEVIQPSILPTIGAGGFVRIFRRRRQRGAIWTDEED